MRVLILDTETTGLDPAVDRCIEVGCILYDTKAAAVIASYASLIGQEDTANAAESINRIAPAMLVSAPTHDFVWNIVKNHAKTADAILAHRAEFDRGFVPLDLRTIRPWVCTKFHVEWPLGKMGDHLVHLALAHGVGILSAHRALTDCDTLARLLTRVHEMGSDLDLMLTRADGFDAERRGQVTFAGAGLSNEVDHFMPIDEVESLTFRTSEMPS